MADRPNVRTRPLPRNKLAEFLTNHELIKTFENITQDVAKVLPDATLEAAENAEEAKSLANLLKVLQFVLLSGSPTAPNARTLAVGPGLTLTDEGASKSVTLDLKLSTSGAVLADDVTESAGQFTDAPGLSLMLAKNAAYEIDGIFGFQADAAVPAVDIGFALPVGSILTGRCGNLITTSPLSGASGTPSVVHASGTTSVVAGRWVAITSTTAGAAQLRFRTLLETYGVTLEAGQCAISARRIA